MSIELEFEGKDVNEAVEKACFAHQVSAAELDYEIIRQESKKIFGLIGGKTALIRVRKKEVSGRELVKDIIDSTFKGEEFSTSVDQVAPVSVSKRDTEPESSFDEEVARSFDAEMICASLKEIIERMGLGPCEIDSQSSGRELRMHIRGQEQGIMTRKRGAVLDALQFLLNKMHGIRGGRIILDCNDFRSRHEQDISDLARRLGAKAKRLRKPVTINSLNAHDRRLVHIALQDDQDLKSRSKGEGEFKKVVIYPNNSRARRPRDKSQTAEAV